MKILEIGLNDSNQRIDKFIFKTFPKFSRSAVYKAIRTKKIKVNGKRVEINHILKIEDRVYIYGFNNFIDKKKVDKCLTLLKLNKNLTTLKIKYEDENLIVLHKPAGLKTQPDKFLQNSLISQVWTYLSKKGELNLNLENSFLPAVCGRLDIQTQGLVVVAKNFNTLKILNNLIKNRKIKKFYVCIAHGYFKHFNETLINWLKKNENFNKSEVIEIQTKNSKKAVLTYKVLKQFENYAKLQIELKTGRHHQIRAQLSYLGHPIVGDLKYGSNVNCNMKLGCFKLIFNTKNTELNYLDGLTIETKFSF